MESKVMQLTERWQLDNQLLSPPVVAALLGISVTKVHAFKRDGDTGRPVPPYIAKAIKTFDLLYNAAPDIARGQMMQARQEVEMANWKKKQSRG